MPYEKIFPLKKKQFTRPVKISCNECTRWIWDLSCKNKFIVLFTGLQKHLWRKYITHFYFIGLNLILSMSCSDGARVMGVNQFPFLNHIICSTSCLVYFTWRLRRSLVSFCLEEIYTNESSTEFTHIFIKTIILP